jgi:hypothetical protein
VAQVVVAIHTMVVDPERPVKDLQVFKAQF